MSLPSRSNSFPMWGMSPLTSCSSEGSCWAFLNMVAVTLLHKCHLGLRNWCKVRWGFPQSARHLLFPSADPSRRTWVGGLIQVCVPVDRSSENLISILKGGQAPLSLSVLWRLPLCPDAPGLYAQDQYPCSAPFYFGSQSYGVLYMHIIRILLFLYFSCLVPVCSLCSLRRVRMGRRLFACTPTVVSPHAMDALVKGYLGEQICVFFLNAGNWFGCAVENIISVSWSSHP